MPRSTTETDWPRNSRTVVPLLTAVRDTVGRARLAAVLAVLWAAFQVRAALSFIVDHQESAAWKGTRSWIVPARGLAECKRRVTAGRS